MKNNGLFKTHYDGLEKTLNRTACVSTRFYYYNIDHVKVLPMLRYLRLVGVACKYKIKILPCEDGNFNFD